MKDEHDKRTIDFIEPVSHAKSFDKLRGTYDEKSLCEPLPKGAKPALGGLRFCQSGYVPVSHAAKDWKVSARRIRALLSAGRLDGRLLDNGYWEVLYPYAFIFGTRGPSLKRQRKPDKPKKTELRAV